MTAISVTLGTCNDIAIVAAVSPGELSDALQTITLAYDYHRDPSASVGWPWTPPGSDYPTQVTSSTPHIFPAGTVLTVLSAEGRALVSAGVTS